MVRRYAVSLLSGLVLLALPGATRARDLSLFARAALGGSFGTVDSSYGYEQPSATGKLLPWEAAVGVRVSRWFALHATTFGGYAPNARTNVDGQRGRGPFWVQTTGAGFTLSPRQGWSRWPDYRGYLSASAGLALVDSPMTHALGAGTEIVFGLERRLGARWWLGLAVQGTFQGRRSFRLAYEDGYKSGHAGLILSLTCDARSGAR